MKTQHIPTSNIKKYTQIQTDKNVLYLKKQKQTGKKIINIKKLN